MPVSQLPLVTGETLNTRSLNDKPTVYYFFAPWCKVCEYSIDNLTALEPQWREDKVNVLIIALDYSSLNEVTAYIDRHQLPFPVALGSRTIAERYKINGYPTYYIADAEGILNWVSVGYSTELGLITRLQLL
ncbi:MAG: redoxin domain-containing protein [Gammaproteobacteria bacterium]|nr:redoxin domain-containing protein [Gammaproteobacteria bacterium]NVK87456.1 redoxin domain-containing protein [Gammaproteobacteria bacterium]